MSLDPDLVANENTLYSAILLQPTADTSGEALGSVEKAREREREGGR